MAIPRSHHTATLLPDGKVLVAGGDGGLSGYDGGLSNGAARVDAAGRGTEVYDPTESVWLPGPPMAEGRYGATAALLSGPDCGGNCGKVIIAGGSSRIYYGNPIGCTPVKVSFLVNQTVCPPNPQDDLHITFSGALNTTELRDPVTGVWTPGPPMNIPRAGQTASGLDNGEILVSGGQTFDPSRIPGAEAGYDSRSAEIFDSKTTSWRPTVDMTSARSSQIAAALGDGRVLVAGGTEDAGKPEPQVFNRQSQSSLSVLPYPLVGGVESILSGAPPTVNIDDVTVVRPDSGIVNAQFTLSLSRPSTSQVNVDYVTADDSAKEGRDYQFTDRTAQFAPGKTSVAVDIPVYSGNSPADKSFFVELSDPDHAVIGKKEGRARIIGTRFALSIDDRVAKEGTSQGSLNASVTTNFTFGVHLSKPSSTSIKVSYKTVDGSAKQAEPDYVSASGTITFRPGETSRQADISVSGDALSEPDETFYVELSDPSSGADISKGRGVGTILNDDGGVSVGDTYTIVPEGAGADEVFAVNLSAAQPATVTVDYATADGTATAGGGDYVPKARTLSFAPGETAKTVSVPVTGRGQSGAYFYLNLSNSNAAIEGPQGKATILRPTWTKRTFQRGDLFVGSAQNRVLWFDPAGVLLAVLSPPTSGPGTVAGMAFGPGANLYVTKHGEQNIDVYASTGEYLKRIETAYIPYPQSPLSIVFDKRGYKFLGIRNPNLGGPFNRIVELDTHDNFSRSFSPANAGHATSEISGNLDLAADQCTVLLRSEDTFATPLTDGGNIWVWVQRFDTCTGRMSSDFARLSRDLAGDVRVLPDGGLLVADRVVRRLDSKGDPVRKYDIPYDADLRAGASGPFIRYLSLDAGGKSFWAADAVWNRISKVDLETGEVLQTFRVPGKVNSFVSPSPDVGAIAVFGGCTAATGCGVGAAEEGAGAGRIEENLNRGSGSQFLPVPPPADPGRAAVGYASEGSPPVGADPTGVVSGTPQVPAQPIPSGQMPQAQAGTEAQQLAQGVNADQLATSLAMGPVYQEEKEKEAERAYANPGSSVQSYFARMRSSAPLSAGVAGVVGAIFALGVSLMGASPKAHRRIVPIPAARPPVGRPGQKWGPRHRRKT